MMITDLDSENPCLERLQREAFDCLDSFPGKVIELNEIIYDFMPDSVKNDSASINTIRPSSRSQSTLSSLKNYMLSTSPEFNVASCYSLSTYCRSRHRHGVCKRKHYRVRSVNGTTMRRRPGPLGQLLAFVASRLVVCTKKIIMAPSYYIMNNIITLFFQRRQVKNAQCGTPTNWNNSLSTFAIGLENDNTSVGSLISIMRSAAVQLIADTTILKRWLQALALTSTEAPSSELASATRNAETIDGWAYELFFHVKYLQMNRAQRTVDEAVDVEEKTSEEMTHINLWHRLVQLRDNYIILYESLYMDRKIQNLSSKK